MPVFFKYAALIALLTICLLVSLMTGEYFVSPSELLNVFTGNADDLISGIIMNLRLPRIGAAFLAGSALAVSGTVFQSVLKNPLADPYIVGVSGGAALGAAIGIVFTPNGLAPGLLAFAGGLAAVSFVEIFSRRYAYGSAALILTGISVSFVVSSAVMLLFCFAKSEDVHRALMWLMGDLSIARYDFLPYGFIVCLILFFIIIFHHRHCDIISLGSDFSRSSGVTVRNVRLLFWAASLLAAVSVAIVGVIGFVGLIVPHILRYIFGSGHLRLLPLSIVTGGMFLVCCDALGRSVISPYEIPVGVITGFCGGMFFLVYMLSGRGREVLQ